MAKNPASKTGTSPMMTPEQLRKQAQWFRDQGLARTAELADLAAAAQEQGDQDGFTPEEIAEITEFSPEEMAEITKQ